jgi:hypothetical protein
MYLTCSRLSAAGAIGSSDDTRGDTLGFLLKVHGGDLGGPEHTHEALTFGGLGFRIDIEPIIAGRVDHLSFINTVHRSTRGGLTCPSQPSSFKFFMTPPNPFSALAFISSVTNHGARTSNRWKAASTKAVPADSPCARR